MTGFLNCCKVLGGPHLLIKSWVICFKVVLKSAHKKFGIKKLKDTHLSVSKFTSFFKNLIEYFKDLLGDVLPICLDHPSVGRCEKIVSVNRRIRPIGPRSNRLRFIFV